MTNEREQRGLVIAATAKVIKKGGVWLVPSQSGKSKYTVCPDKEHPHCSCPDHETRGCKCKHIFAVEFVIQRELFDNGSVIETRQLTISEKRTTYPQNWPAYNAAQTNEKATFQMLLRDLVSGVQEPEQRMGRPRANLQDALFSACFKVYSTVSGRRFMTDLREAHERGYISRTISFGSLFKVFESPDTFPILRALVERSAAPLRAVEVDFACDSTGFSGCRFDRWFDHKYGTPLKKQYRAWVKAHVMCGVKTNVVTAVEIFEHTANDGVQLPKLLATTTQRFSVREVSADMAYSSHNNLCKIAAAGGSPLIPFKSNATPAQGGLWAKMFHYVNLHRDEFLARYHKRSNVEATFSAIKRVLGDSLRSKTDVAMKNEALAKLVCHNVICVIHEMHEQGIDPAFWAAA